MTGEELAALIEAEIGENERLQRILDRIQDGSATFTDSELYAAITAEITAKQMRRNVFSLDGREAAFVDITWQRHSDTFTVFSAVQRILDARSGIRIKPQKPPFEEGRAHKIGNALEDKTVPDSVIERRARSATENFCMSHHDDCMKVNAEFRARAGLQTYAIRDGSARCCDWCADVSGKYPANETPPGFWGRHDNCKCSILYESKRGGRQLLRGTSKKWEQVAPGAGAGELHRLTAEQAAAMGAGEPVVLTKDQTERFQEKHQLKRLTNSSEKRIIELSINLFDPSDPIYLDALSIEEEPGFEDFHSHGAPQSIELWFKGRRQIMSAEQFARELTETKAIGYRGGDIRLCSCSTGKGENSFAQQLSKILGVKVKAPDDVVYYIPEDGVIFIGSRFGNTGKWRVFDKGVEIT